MLNLPLITLNDARTTVTIPRLAWNCCGILEIALEFLRIQTEGTSRPERHEDGINVHYAPKESLSYKHYSKAPPTRLIVIED